MSKYRVFISYSHQDAPLVDKIVEVLEENGLQPMRMTGFTPGEPFPDQIKDYIAHSSSSSPPIETPSLHNKKSDGGNLY